MKAIKIPIHLPLISDQNRSLYIVLGYFFFSGLYLASGRFRLFDITILENNIIDQQIPFLKGSIWCYVSHYVFAILSIYGCREPLLRSQGFYAMMVSTLIACSFFVLFPTELPRVIIKDSGITSMLWHFLYFIDVPGNCFPSLHVAIAGLGTWMLMSNKGVWLWLAPLWGMTIVVSTLTTAQHIVIDVLAGLLIAKFSLNGVKYAVRFEHKIDGITTCKP